MDVNTRNHVATMQFSKKKFWKGNQKKSTLNEEKVTSWWRIPITGFIIHQKQRIRWQNKQWKQAHLDSSTIIVYIFPKRRVKVQIINYPSKLHNYHSQQLKIKGLPTLQIQNNWKAIHDMKQILHVVFPLEAKLHPRMTDMLQQEVEYAGKPFPLSLSEKCPQNH